MSNDDQIQEPMNDPAGLPPGFDAEKIDFSKLPNIAIIRLNRNMFRQFYLLDPRFTSATFMIVDPEDDYLQMKEDQIVFASWNPDNHQSVRMGTVTVQPKYPGQTVRLTKMAPHDRKEVIRHIFAQTFLLPAGTPKQ